jgi:hypothetical protein
MEIGIRIPLFFDLADLDDAFGSLVQQAQNFVIDAINFFPVLGKVSGHSYSPLFPPDGIRDLSIGWNGTGQVGNDTGTVPTNARRPLTFQELA